MEPATRIAWISGNVSIHPISGSWWLVAELLTIQPDLCPTEPKLVWRNVTVEPWLLANVSSV
jgi:hypothetical protein